MCVCVCVLVRAVATSCIDLSGGGFVLTQDDVRGDDRVRHVDEVTPAYASVPPLRPGRVAVARSASSAVPLTDAHARHRPLQSVLTTPDVSAGASTWLDDVQPSDDDRLSRPRPAHEQSQRADDDTFDFHFGIGAVSSAPSSSSSSSQQQQPAAAISSRPVALVQPHKVTGVRVMPDELSAGLLSWSQGKQAKPPPPAASTTGQPPSRAGSDAAQPEDGGRVRNREERRTVAAPTSMSSRDQLKATPSRDTGTSSSSLPVNRRREVGAGSVAPRPAPRSTITTANDQAVTVAVGDQLTNKDREIASAVGNMKLDKDGSTTQSTLSAHGTNFEKCLGYFP